MDSSLQDLTDKAVNYAKKSGVQYCDARGEQQEKKSVLIENNQIDHIRTNEDKGIGIRIIKNGVWSFCSITNPQSFNQIKEAVDNSIRSATYNKKNEQNKIDLNPNAAYKTEINFPVLKKPELDELIKIGFECNEIISKTPKIIKSIINPGYTVNSKYFVNSEGSEIIQNYTDVTVDMIAIAHESGITQSINTTEGGRGGLEQITDKNKIQNKANVLQLC